MKLKDLLSKVNIRAVYQKTLGSYRFDNTPINENSARAMNKFRLDLGKILKEETGEISKESLEKIKEANQKAYGNPLGPSYEYLKSKGKSDEDIMRSSLKFGGEREGLEEMKKINEEASIVVKNNQAYSVEYFSQSRISSRGQQGLKKAIEDLEKEVPEIGKTGMTLSKELSTIIPEKHLSTLRDNLSQTSGNRNPVQNQKTVIHKKNSEVSLV